MIEAMFNFPKFLWRIVSVWFITVLRDPDMFLLLVAAIALGFVIGPLLAIAIYLAYYVFLRTVSLSIFDGLSHNK